MAFLFAKCLSEFSFNVNPQGIILKKMHDFLIFHGVLIIHKETIKLGKLYLHSIKIKEPKIVISVKFTTCLHGCVVWGFKISSRRLQIT